MLTGSCLKVICLSDKFSFVLITDSQCPLLVYSISIIIVSSPVFLYPGNLPAITNNYYIVIDTM